jgi:hypothetical protein
VTMQLFVRDDRTMIAAPVQCDVDGIPKGSHYVRVPIAIRQGSLTRIRLQLAIHFCLHRGSLPENSAGRQPRFRRKTPALKFSRKTICHLESLCPSLLPTQQFLAGI